MIPLVRPERAVENVRRLDSPDLSRAGRFLLKSARAEAHVGSGMEKDVFDYGENTVISFFTHASLEPAMIAPMLKTLYYSAKLGHLLMPDSIPDAHLAVSRPPAIVFDKVEGERHGITFAERGAFRRRLESLGITHACDLADGNLIRRPDGSLAYVDTVNGYMLIRNPELDAHIQTLPAQTAREARRLQRQLLKHSQDWD